MHGRFLCDTGAFASVDEIDKVHYSGGIAAVWAA